MLPITNAKVETLDPTWARFVGYSLLFDNPGDSLRSEGRIERIHCNVDTTPDLKLYRELSKGISGLAKEEGLCLLPAFSYHVTVFDGGNQANAPGAHPEIQASLIHLIEGLPESWNDAHDLVHPAVQNSITMTTSGSISFRYSYLKNWDNVVLVAVLEPSDEQSQINFDRLVEERAMLSNHCRSSYGFGAGPKFTPHVSLAYFANQDCGERAGGKLEEWNDALRQRTQDLCIHFDSISAYAFTDMATFFREKRAG